MRFVLLAPAVATALLLPAHAPRAEVPGTSSGTSSDELPWFTIAPKLGYATVGEGSFETEVSDGMGGKKKITIDTAARSGLRLAVDLAMGGDALGFDISPFVTFESDDADNSSTAFGAYTGLAWRQALTPGWRLHTGAGLQAAYLDADALDLGLELFARVPVGATWQVTPAVGAVVEFGLGYGATGLKGKAPEKPAVCATSPDLPGCDVEAPDLEFGTGLVWDFSLGARF